MKIIFKNENQLTGDYLNALLLLHSLTDTNETTQR